MDFKPKLVLYKDSTTNKNNLLITWVLYLAPFENISFI